MKADEKGAAAYQAWEPSPKMVQKARNEDIIIQIASACANFIHQKDAYIAMKVVEHLLWDKAPIYTVHDNFITTPPCVKQVPDVYTKVYIEMGNPLRIINEFIKNNLIDLYYNTQDRENHLIYYYDSNTPFPTDILEYFMISLSPTKDKKKWQLPRLRLDYFF